MAIMFGFYLNLSHVCTNRFIGDTIIIMLKSNRPHTINIVRCRIIIIVFNCVSQTVFELLFVLAKYDIVYVHCTVFCQCIFKLL